MAQAYRLDDENKENATGRVFINFSVRAAVALQIDQICDSLQIDRSKFFKSILTYVLESEDIEGFIKPLYENHLSKLEQKLIKTAVSRRSKQVVLPPEPEQSSDLVEGTTPRPKRGRPAGRKNNKTLAFEAALREAFEANKAQETVEASIEE